MINAGCGVVFAHGLASVTAVDVGKPADGLSAIGRAGTDLDVTVGRKAR